MRRGKDFLHLLLIGGGGFLGYRNGVNDFFSFNLGENGEWTLK